MLAVTVSEPETDITNVAVFVVTVEPLVGLTLVGTAGGLTLVAVVNEEIVE